MQAMRQTGAASQLNPRKGVSQIGGRSLVKQSASSSPQRSKNIAQISKNQMGGDNYLEILKQLFKNENPGNLRGTSHNKGQRPSVQKQDKGLQNFE
jgi:hypothetical protein